PPGEDRTTILGDGLERQCTRVSGIDAVFDRACDPSGGYGERGRIERPDHLADRAHRTGAAGAVLPPAAPELRLHGLELEARCAPRPLEALGGDLAIAEETLAPGDAPHLQAFELERVQPLADDELGAAAADVDHQAFARLARQRMRDARVDEARFFHSRDAFDPTGGLLARALARYP